MLDQLLPLLPGLDLSLRLFAASLVIGLPLGVIGGWILHWGDPVSRTVVVLLVEIGRGFPALVTLYLVYFGLPEAGIVLDAFGALVLAFAYTTASYTADIFRSSLAAVPKNQLEAAEALSLNGWDTFRFVIWPQALRLALGPVRGFSIIVFQATALAYSIGLRELVSRAYDQGSIHFNVLPYMAWAALLYLLVALALSGISKLIQRRISLVVPIKAVKIITQKTTI
jgi:polar amino acid transport system permease protein